MNQDLKAGQIDNAEKRVLDRMKDLELLSEKGNEAIKTFQEEIAERQRKIAHLRDELIRMQGAYAELKSQLPSDGDKKKEGK